MSEWLDLMLDEIARKRRDEAEAREELRRRKQEKSAKSRKTADQPK